MLQSFREQVESQELVRDKEEEQWQLGGEE